MSVLKADYLNVNSMNDFTYDCYTKNISLNIYSQLDGSTYHILT